MPYPVPSIPDTPSSSINEVLRKHFSEPPDNVLKAVVSHFICAQFSSILMAYKALKRGDPGESFQMWAAACALVSLALALASFVAYKLIMMSTFLLYTIIRYGLGGLALLGVAMGAAGVVFYDRKDDERSAATRGAVASAAAPAAVTDEKLGYTQYKPAVTTKTFQETDIDKTD